MWDHYLGPLFLCLVSDLKRHLQTPWQGRRLLLVSDLYSLWPLATLRSEKLTLEIDAKTEQKKISDSAKVGQQIRLP